jgi:hypothetical protein
VQKTATESSPAPSSRSLTERRAAIVDADKVASSSGRS